MRLLFVLVVCFGGWGPVVAGTLSLPLPANTGRIYVVSSDCFLLQLDFGTYKMSADLEKIKQGGDFPFQFSRVDLESELTKIKERSHIVVAEWKWSSNDPNYLQLKSDLLDHHDAYLEYFSPWDRLDDTESKKYNHDLAHRYRGFQAWIWGPYASTPDILNSGHTFLGGIFASIFLNFVPLLPGSPLCGLAGALMVSPFTMRFLSKIYLYRDSRYVFIRERFSVGQFSILQSAVSGVAVAACIRIMLELSR
jgi:hypothetical protein